MIKEHEEAVLTRDLPEEGLAAGDVGTVIAVHEDEKGEAASYTLEIFGLAGETLAMVTVAASAVREVHGGEVIHARELGKEPAG